MSDGVPIGAFIDRIARHIKRPVTKKEFALLYSGWVTRYCVTTRHGVSQQAASYWLIKGYVPREHANNLMNYLITGETIV